MPLPKSVVKINKDGVTFISNVDRVNYTIRELSRRALMDVGRFITYECAKKVRGIKSLAKVPYSAKKYFGKAYQYWVRKEETDLRIGIHNVKYTEKDTWYGGQAELGTNGQPKRAILTTTVQENIDTIREIEARYLSAIEDERKAIALIEEEEAIGDGEDEA